MSRSTKNGSSLFLVHEKNGPSRRAHVSRYLARIRPEPTKPRSQTWIAFLKNHARDIVAADMFVVPTIRFQVLYIFIILGLERRRLVFANVTTNPTAQWLAQQVVNAFPWDTANSALRLERR
jgi:hypothetical protein